MSARATAIRTSAANDPALVAKLHGAGLRRTGPRMAVLQRLGQLETPVSHGDLAEAVAPLGFDRATVYRNLMDLVEAGLVTRADLGDHVWRFSLVRAGEAAHARKHPHLLCTDCGTVVCLPDVKVKISPARGQQRVAEMEVQLKGLCDRCDN